jgi:hypothetical protein
LTRLSAVEPATRPALDAGARQELIRLADVTLAEYLRCLASYGGAVAEEDGLLLFAGPHGQPNPYRNGLLRLNGTLGADETLRRARAFFAPRRRGFAMWTREHGSDADLERIAADSGLTELERLPEFFLEEAPAALPLPPGVELRRTVEARTCADFLAVIADAWGMGRMPLDVAAKVFFDPELLRAPNVVAWVAYFGGRPLSAAMGMLVDGVAFGGHAGTVSRIAPGSPRPPRMPADQRRSLAAHCAARTIETCLGELGARVVLCQASTQGAPVWEQLGFQRFTAYGRYLVPAISPAAR